VVAEDLRRLRRHRRVEVERQHRDLAALEHPVELPDDLLRPADRERRHESTPLWSATRRTFREDPVRLVLGLVLAASVRRLDEHVVGLGLDRRIADDRACPAGRGRR
jgi:hypothetical protein